MINKKIIIGISCGVAVLALTAGLIFGVKKESAEVVKQPHQNVKKHVKPAVTETLKIKTPNLYSETPYEIPLSAIAELLKSSQKAQEKVDKLLDNSQGFYVVKYNEAHKRLEILLQNPVTDNNTYPRHNLEFAYIDNDGNVTFSQKGYTGKKDEILTGDESENDVWEFDKSVEPYRPLKHTSYDEHGNIKFTEIWNYEDSEPVKYEMKNSHDKIISILKETFDNNNYRKEHVFYDKDGNTETSLSANYDGANLSRLTYYDAPAHKGISIISEYTDGNKTKEVIYDQDYELLNTIKSEYENGKRKNITILDPDSKEIETISD